MIHTKPGRGQTQTWLTPLSIIEKLGPFDLDPCCPRWMPWRTAKTMISNDSEETPNPDFMTKLADGLTEDWGNYGRTYTNPPYGAKECNDWLKKLADHGNGIALIASRTETQWWIKQIWERADALLFIYKRLNFCHQDGTPGEINAGHGSVLVAYGNSNVKSLDKSGIPGKLIRL